MAIFRDTGPVADGIYLIDIGIWGIEKQMAVYIVKSSDLIALIDTGTKRETETVLKEISHQGISKVDYIFSTHSHIDHCGGLYNLGHKFPEAIICIPQKAYELKKEFEKKSQKLGITNSLQLLKEGDSIRLDPDFILTTLETPGHIDDHLSILDQKHQVLFVGDACGSHNLGAGFSRPTAYAPYFNHEAYIETLLKYQKINPVGLGIASYGYATDHDAEICIKRAINDYNQWKDTVILAMRENPDDDYVAERLLQQFGRSPGEISENRPDQWVKSILRGIARGFINSLGLNKK